MEALIDKLRFHWQWNRLTFRSGTSPESIEAFEAKYNVILPADLRLYHLQIDGMEEGKTDNELFAFLPLSQIKSVPEELPSFAGIPNYSEIADRLPDAKRCFVFVDYMMMSHVYAIRLSSDPNIPTPVYWICGPFWEEIAPSFSIFIEKYLQDTNSIFSHTLHDTDGKYLAQMKQYVADFKRASRSEDFPHQIWKIAEKLKALFSSK